MRKKIGQNIFILFLLMASFIFVLAGLVLENSEIFAQERTLEIEYPEAPGVPSPETTKTLLPDYVRYVFNFIVIIVGIIALGVLIIGGIRYLNSAGKPEKLKEAKKQVLAAFWGVIILLSSYLILTTISPQIVSIQLPEIPEVPFSPSPVPTTPVPTKDLLGRIKELAGAIKETPDSIKALATKIKSLTGNCDCANTQPICLCTGGGAGSACQPRQCYAGAKFHPCPQAEEIKSLQKNIVDWRDVILYYRTRTLSEKDDLTLDIEKFINQELNWYDEEIAANEKILSQLEGEGEKELRQRLIDYLKKKKEWLEEEKGYKEELTKKLENLANSIAKMSPPVLAMVQLSGQCFLNVGTKCVPSCKTGGTYGCHDRLSGCQPDKCSGGNPCPVSKIQTELGKINPLPAEIMGLCDEIISIVDGIKKERIMEIIL